MQCENGRRSNSNLGRVKEGSISFHLKSCPKINYLALTCAQRQIQHTAARIHTLFILFLAKLLRPQLSTRHSHFANLPRYLFSLFCSFLPSNIPCRFQSTVPCLINDHHRAASRKLYPRPSQNKVHELRA